MTPESIITNSLEQALKLKCSALVFIVQGSRTLILAKSINHNVPLFQVPTPLFFSASNMLFEENEFDETKNYKFAPEATLKIVRIRSERIVKSTHGKDLLLTTTLTGRTRYQVMWFIDISRDELKGFEGDVNKVELGKSIPQSEERDLAELNHEKRVSAAVKSQEDYEAYLAFLRLNDDWEYQNKPPRFKKLSRGEGFFTPYITIGFVI